MHDQTTPHQCDDKKAEDDCGNNGYFDEDK